MTTMRSGSQSSRVCSGASSSWLMMIGIHLGGRWQQRQLKKSTGIEGGVRQLLLPLKCLQHFLGS